MGSRTGALLLLLALGVPAAAAELDGVQLDDRVSSGGRELVLNGLGLRTRLFFKVYVAGLYLPEKTQSADAALAMPGPKRMTMVMMRDIGAGQFSDALLASLRKNVPESELAALQAPIDDLMGRIGRIGEAKKGTVIELDFAPDAGTVLRVGGALQGPPIEGEALFRALLRTWVGERPAQGDLKKALLGQAD
jgi:hypothetical protein